ncbi:hypothetical protein TRICI_003224 [Trichomonascus ciferrii]|uniref:F-box domain-containing protein n=1 Tax=Trichomonascus ciferrii TaxID=44093 RepID=A0A642V4Q3_9ASCO|nr:hypothetical protein TRICI_003224 [Trichomonascus ciferrii]
MHILHLSPEVISITCQGLEYRDLVCLRATCRALTGPATDAIRVKAWMVQIYSDCVINNVRAIGEEESIFQDYWFKDRFQHHFPQWLEGNLVDVRLDMSLDHNQKEDGLLALKHLASKLANAHIDVVGDYNVDKNEFKQLVEIVATSTPNMTFGAKIYMNGAIGIFFIPDKVTRLSIYYGRSVGDFPQFSPTSRCQVYLEILGGDTEQVLDLLHNARQNTRNLSLAKVTLKDIPLTDPLMSRLETLEFDSPKLEGCLRSTPIPPTKGITCKSMKELVTTSLEEFSYFTSPSLRDVRLVFTDRWSREGNFIGLQRLKEALERCPSLTRVKIEAREHNLDSADTEDYWRELFVCFVHLEDLEAVIINSDSPITGDCLDTDLIFLGKALPRLHTFCATDEFGHSYELGDGEIDSEYL